MFGTEMKTNNGKRFIAAFVTIAMIVCAVAFAAMPANADTMDVVDKSNFTDPEVISSIDDFKNLSTLFETNDVVILDVKPEGTYLTSSEAIETINVPAGKTLVIGANGYDTNGYDDTDPSSIKETPSLVIEVTNLNVDGTLYNNVGASKATSVLKVTNLTLGDNGALYSTCALSWGTSSSAKGFFTNSNGFYDLETQKMTEYRNMYAGNINTLIPYVNNADYKSATTEGLEEVKAIFTYGDVTIGQNTTLNDLTLYIGGVGANNESTLTVAKGANLTVNSTAKVTLAANNKDTSSVINNGTIGVYGTYNATTDSTNGSVRILSETAVYDVNAITGTIDTSAISSEATLSGELQTNNTVFTANQVVTITKDLNLIAGASLIIKGTMIIPEGVTVTIQEGAQLIIDTSTASVENNGTIVIQSYRCGVTSQDGKTFTDMSYTGGNSSKVTYGFAVINGATVENNGTISLEYTMTMDDTGAQDVFDIGAGSTVTNNGTLTVGSESGIIINGIVKNAADATLTINGKVTATTDKTDAEIENAGTITVNATIANHLGISNSAVDATVQITSMAGNISIDDKALKGEKIEAGNNAVGLSTAADHTIGGIVVKTVTVVEEEKTYRAMDISGTTAVTYTGSATNHICKVNTDGTGDSAMRLTGERILVTTEFNIGAGVALNFGSDAIPGKLTVSGTMNITANKASTGEVQFYITSTPGSEITVTGTIASLYKIDGVANCPALNAAAYSKTANAVTTYYYTTLVNALSSGEKAITVYGTTEVTEDATVADGVTVTQADPSEIKIAEDVTLTIADGGKISQKNTSTSKVTVEGTLYVTVEKTGFRNQTAVSDVKSSNGTDATYTNLAKAMADANDGDVIKLHADTVTVDYAFTIKDGVTLDTNEKDFIVSGATLTVNGTLFINGGDYSVQDRKSTTSEYVYESGVVLNGYIKNAASMDYNAMVTDEITSKQVLQNEYPAGAYYSVAENGVTYNYISTVVNAAANTANMYNNTFEIFGEVTVPDISVTGTEDNEVVIVVDAKADVTAGTITMDYAKLNIENGGQFDGAVTNGVGTVDVALVDKVNDKKEDVPASGTVIVTATTDDEGTKKLIVTGVESNATLTFEGTAYTDDANVAEIIVNGTVDVIGETVVKSKVTVAGTLNVTSDGVLTAGEATAYIYGTLNIAVATESDGAGNATFGTMYVGLSVDKEKIVTETAGTVTGPVSVSGNTYVSSESSIPTDISEKTGIKNTQFFVEDTLWLTVYGTGNASVPNAPATDAKFIGWNNADGETLYYADKMAPATGGPYGSASTISIADNDKLYAEIDFNVYNVTIRTDGGIKSVAIDGNILAQTLGNGFVATGLTAGQHTVSYTLKNGYQGEATLTGDGITVNGMTFTLSGDYSETIYLSLSGTEPATSVSGGSTSSDDGLGLTDYLLIILVVLIVIMAIMVAMRLMRS